MQVLAVYDDFSGGHWGEDQLGRPGTFGGENFIPVAGGHAVKIREGTVLLSNTGMANTANVAIWPAANGIIASTGTTCWFVPLVGAPTALTAFGASTLSNVTDWCHYRQGVLITIFTDTTYYTNFASNTALGGSAPGGLGVAALGDRVYVAGISANTNRLRWSDAANDGSWTGTNFVDIGTNTSNSLQALESQRNSLIAVLSGSGIVNEWYRISGTPGLDQTVTPVAPRGPLLYGSGGYMVPGANSRIWFTPQPGGSIIGNSMIGNYGWIDSDTPQLSSIPRPNNSTDPFNASTGLATGYRIADSPNLGATFMSELNFASSPTIRQRNLLRLDGIWSSHVFTFTGTSTTTTGWNVMHSYDRFFIAHGGSASTKPQFYAWQLVTSLHNAPIETDASGVADVSATLELPPHYDPTHRDLQVQAVVVDYRQYSTNTTFTCGVDTLGVYQTSSPVSGSTQTASSLGGVSTVGERGQYVFYPSPVQTGPGFKVTLSACKAVAIERVTVLGAIAPSIV